jgi:hypothetical protein
MAQLLLHARALAQAGVSDKHAESGLEGRDRCLPVVRWDVVDYGSQGCQWIQG